MEEILQTLATAPSELTGQYIGFLRYAVPVMTFLLLLRCAFPLLTFRREPEIWAWLNLTDGTQIPITHWENVIGRSKSCDVTIDFSTISRNHAVLTRYDDGSWTLLDIGSKTGTLSAKIAASVRIRLSSMAVFARTSFSLFSSRVR